MSYNSFSGYQPQPYRGVTGDNPLPFYVPPTGGLGQFSSGGGSGFTNPRPGNNLPAASMDIPGGQQAGSNDVSTTSIPTQVDPMSYFSQNGGYNPLQYLNSSGQANLQTMFPSASFGQTSVGGPNAPPSQTLMNYGGVNHNGGLVQNLINQYGLAQATAMLNAENAYAAANGGGNYTLQNDPSSAAFHPTNASYGFDASGHALPFTPSGGSMWANPFGQTGGGYQPGLNAPMNVTPFGGAPGVAGNGPANYIQPQNAPPLVQRTNTPAANPTAAPSNNVSAPSSNNLGALLSLLMGGGNMFGGFGGLGATPNLGILGQLFNYSNLMNPSSYMPGYFNRNLAYYPGFY